MDCNDIGCRTNDPDSKVICTKCLKLVLDNLTVEELYDVYYYIYDLLGMSPKVREALEAIFGKRPLRDIESFKEDWFDFINAKMIRKANNTPDGP